ncbi:MAG TPA: HAD family phosphatase [Candidatus Deferrimicrobium sp.]
MILSEQGRVIRGVIFDFGNVICSFDVEKFLAKLQEWSGLDVETLRDRVYGSRLHSRYERGEISSKEFHREVVRRIGVDVPVEQLAEGFTDIFTPIESTHGLIRALKGKVRLGLLSNTNEWHFLRHIRKVPVFPLFDAVTLSFEVGALKPEPEIYLDALRKLSLPPEACVFIDDIRKYAEGAAVVGIRGILYTGHAELLRELSGLGVVPPQRSAP